MAACCCDSCCSTCNKNSRCCRVNGNIVIWAICTLILFVTCAAMHILFNTSGFESYRKGVVRTMAYIHANTAIPFFMVGCHQFFWPSRYRYPKLHAKLALIYSLCTWAAAISVLVMATVGDATGYVGALTVFFYIPVWMFMLIRGISRVKEGRIQQHRRWMTRHFFLACAVPLQRLIVFPTLGFIFAVYAPEEFEKPMIGVTLWICLVITTATCEAYLYYKYRGSLMSPLDEGSEQAITDPTYVSFEEPQLSPITRIEVVSPTTKKYVVALPEPTQRLALRGGLHLRIGVHAPETRTCCCSGSAPMAAPECDDWEYRAYTPINGPERRGEVEFIIKTYPDGVVSSHLDELSVGDSVKLIGPLGSFRYTPGFATHISMFAAGTGITPIYSVIQEIMANALDSPKMRLVYAVRNPDEFLLMDELTELAASGDVEVTLVVSSRDTKVNAIELQGVNGSSASNKKKSSSSKSTSTSSPASDSEEEEQEEAETDSESSSSSSSTPAKRADTSSKANGEANGKAKAKASSSFKGEVAVVDGPVDRNLFLSLAHGPSPSSSVLVCGPVSFNIAVEDWAREARYVEKLIHGFGTSDH